MGVDYRYLRSMEKYKTYYAGVESSCNRLEIDSNGGGIRMFAIRLIRKSNQFDDNQFEFV